MNFGYLLRTLRICAGFSLRELARQIDVSPTYLSLIENGKQPPPSSSRLAKIEQVLEVPPGYLLSIARGFDPTILTYLQNVPEVIDFLNIAKEKELTPADFTALTTFINTHGGERLRQMLQSCTLPAPEAAKEHSCGAYVWPFLEESLIFDLDGLEDKEAFLEQLVQRVSWQCNGVDCDLILSELLKREKIASTGIGHQIAVPHAYVAGLDRLVVAFVRVPDGLDFQSIDGEPIQMALLLAGPHSSKNLHLLLLARIAKLVRSQDFCRQILAASSSSEIISIFRSAEAGIL